MLLTFTAIIENTHPMVLRLAVALTVLIPIFGFLIARIQTLGLSMMRFMPIGKLMATFWSTYTYFVATATVATSRFKTAWQAMAFTVKTTNPFGWIMIALEAILWLVTLIIPAFKSLFGLGSNSMPDMSRFNTPVPSVAGVPRGSRSEGKGTTLVANIDARGSTDSDATVRGIERALEAWGEENYALLGHEMDIEETGG